MSKRSKQECPKCGAVFVKRYNNRVCPDCAEQCGRHDLTSLGREDLVSHFSQDVGLRLQRAGWGHFSG